MTDDKYLDVGSKPKLTIRMPRVSTVLSSLLVLYSVGNLSFLIFGFIANPNIIQPLSAESWGHVIIAAITVLMAAFFFRSGIVTSFWVILLLPIHFLMLPSLGATTGGALTKSWEYLRNQSAEGAITGYNSADFLMSASLLTALLVAMALRRQMVREIRPGSLDGKLSEFWNGYSARFRATGLFDKLAGIFVLIWAAANLFVLIYIYVRIAQQGFNIIENSRFDQTVQLLVVSLVIYFTLRSGWQRKNIAWVVLFAAIWNFGIDSLVFSFANPRSNWEQLLVVQFSGLGIVETAAIILALISLVALSVKAMIQNYAARVMSWIDRRMEELYEEETTGKHPVEPRTTSIMAVLSLIFAFAFPIVGLILAHAARNEIAISKKTKYGTEMTIAAAIISWVGIISSVFLFVTIFVVLPILGFSDFFSFLGTLFGNSQY